MADLELPCPPQPAPAGFPLRVGFVEVDEASNEERVVIRKSLHLFKSRDGRCECDSTFTIEAKTTNKKKIAGSAVAQPERRGQKQTTEKMYCCRAYT